MAQVIFKEQYDKLLNNRDWAGLVNLLNHTSFSNEEYANRANELKRRFQEQADIDAKMLENATDEERDAYNFTMYGPSKTRGDRYSEEFSNLWNSMADENGIIRIHTNPKGAMFTAYPKESPGFFESMLHGNDYLNQKYPKYKAIDSFYEHSGYKEQDLEKAGITLTSDGTLEFSTDNPNKIRIIKGIIGIVDDVNEIYSRYPSGQTPFGINHANRVWKYTGLSQILDIPSTKDYSFGKDSARSGLELLGVSSYDAYNTPLRKLYNLFEDVNTAYSKIMDKAEPYYQELIVTGFMGEDDRLLQQRFSKGVMDVTTYKEARANLEEQYIRLLQNSSLSQYNVYTINNDNKGSQVLEELDDNVSKAELDEIINLAIADKRLHFSSAGNGIMNGTVITIDQKIDSNGNPMDEKHNKSYRFFVKDLFKSTAENDLRKNTLTDAQLQYVRHQTYGHDYKFTDGRKISNWNANTDSAVYTDAFGNTSVLSKGELVDLIDEDIITKGVIDYYKNIIPKNNEKKGNTESYFRLFGNNDYNTDILIDDIYKKTLDVATNKYKGSNEDYIKYKATSLAGIVMRALKLDIKEK